MYLSDKQALKQLLKLIEYDECQLALKTWSDYRHRITKTCDHCPNKDVDKKDGHCKCLEMKLKALSLYQHSSDPYEQLLLNAAHKLDHFCQEPH